MPKPTNGRIFQVSISSGGVPKGGVPEAFITTNGLEGDAVQHSKIHGGLERAVCIYSLERIHLLQEEGHPIFPGAVGENLTLSRIDWREMIPPLLRISRMGSSSGLTRSVGRAGRGGTRASFRKGLCGQATPCTWSRRNRNRWKPGIKLQFPTAKAINDAG